jgi:hypothetical protein
MSDPEETERHVSIGYVRKRWMDINIQIQFSIHAEQNHCLGSAVIGLMARTFPPEPNGPGHDIQPFTLPLLDKDFRQSVYPLFSKAFELIMHL